jgi:hypothetical protein
MVRRQAGGVPQLWLAGGPSECSWPASRVRQTVQAGRGDGAAPRARDVAADFEDADARAGALSGNCGTAHHLGRPALALALCGDATGAEKLAAETSKRLPNGIIWNAVQLPEIRAAIELHGGQPAKAVELLASASPYERAYPEAVYLRGLAYLRLHKGVGRGRVPEDLGSQGSQLGQYMALSELGLYYSISYVGLARASVLAGDTAKARKAFKDFFELWKNADQNLPILIEAKKDYAALH